MHTRHNRQYAYLTPSLLAHTWHPRRWHIPGLPVIAHPTHLVSSLLGVLGAGAHPVSSSLMQTHIRCPRCWCTWHPRRWCIQGVLVIDAHPTRLVSLSLDVLGAGAHLVFLSLTHTHIRCPQSWCTSGVLIADTHLVSSSLTHIQYVTETHPVSLLLMHTWYPHSQDTTGVCFDALDVAAALTCVVETHPCR
jgi:hypothetical protein